MFAVDAVALHHTTFTASCSKVADHGAVAQRQIHHEMFGDDLSRQHAESPALTCRCRVILKSDASTFLALTLP